MTILVSPTQNELDHQLIVEAHRIIDKMLSSSRPGHCLRVTTLSENLMFALCGELNADYLSADIVMLLGPRQLPKTPWQISATRLIELRNAGERPLLAFVPPGLKAAAEDSFDVSTFLEITLEELPIRLYDRLRDQLPTDLQQLVERTRRYLQSLDHHITYDDLVRYFLTIITNNPSREVAGAALYQLRLVPDFTLYQTTGSIEQQLDKNAMALRILTNSSQPILARIISLGLQQNTLQEDLYRFFQNRQVEEAGQWTEIIATNPAYRELAFDRWIFEQEAPREHPLLYVADLELPKRFEDQPFSSENPLYLNVSKTSSVRLKWETKPKPALVGGLSYFRVELVNTDGAMVWQSRNLPNTSSPQTYRSKSIKVADFRDLVQDGVHFFRVRAYSEGDEILNEEDIETHPEVLRDPDNPEGKRINESGDIWVWIEGSGEPPTGPARNVTVTSFLEAQLRAQFAILDRKEDPLSPAVKPEPEKTGWATGKGKRAEAIYNIVYDTQSQFTLPINNVLKGIEQETLSHPEHLGRWRLNFCQNQTYQDITPSLRQHHGLGRVPTDFLQTRAKLFGAIKGGVSGNLTATTDLLSHESLILEYAKAYGAWLRQVEIHFDTYAIHEENGHRHTEALFLDLDTVEVLLPNGGTECERVYLLAPTNPLRLLWHLQYSLMARAWITSVVENGQGAGTLSKTVRSFLLRGLSPTNLPPIMLSAHEGPPQWVAHCYLEQATMGLFWTLYIREDARDGRALRARLQRLLGMTRQDSVAVENGGLGKETLSFKVQRYLVQHPYVHTLRINAFNPGDAKLIVDAILNVEKSRVKMPSLHYDLRLFTSGSRLDDTGEAVEQLQNPERQVTPEANAFLVASSNHLFPKLRFSRNQTEDYLKQPERYEAHISILHDIFPVDVELCPKLPTGRSSYVYGLIQEQVTQFAGDSTFYAWQRQLIPTDCLELANDQQPVSALIATLLQQIATLQASLSTGSKTVDIFPTLRLQLKERDKYLLYQIHSNSDWVFIIDRHLGLEYFDGESGEERPLYLLDSTPEFGSNDAERLLLTTRCTEEITHMIGPTLQNLNLAVGEGVEVYFLRLLRSLSGRLALKLISSPNAVNEAVGLAMARLFLEQYGLLGNRIVIPLDAHLDLFAQAGQEVSLDDEVTLKRSDLLLVSCIPETRTVHLHTIEVKWRAGLSATAYAELCQQIEGQITQTEDALRRHFDPAFQPVDRVDRQLKCRELISLLTFYLERAHRYGLLNDLALEPLHSFIASLDQNYEVSCMGTGLVFDSEFQGVSEIEEHAGLIFYRIGGDYIRRLLGNGLRRLALLQEEARKQSASIEETNKQNEIRHKITRETNMEGDTTFHMVHTHFELGTEESSKKGSYSISESHPDTTLPEQSKCTDNLHKESALVEGQKVKPVLVAGTPLETTETSETAKEPPCDVLLGDTVQTQQYGVLGRSNGRFVALDLNGTNTISLFGVQGGGKSYTVGSIVEMATQKMPGINVLPSPLATVIFHYNESQDYPPEFVSMVYPNNQEEQLRLLADEYGAHPTSLADVLILTSGDKLTARRTEFPGLHVEPIAFSSSELSFKDWRFLMGVTGTQMYMKQINLIMRQLREQMTLESLRQEIEGSELSDGQKSIARIRINFAAQFLDDSRRLSSILQPGRLVIVDLRDEFIDKDEALGLFVVMLNIMANAKRDVGFNKLIVFDEAHKYMDNPDLTDHIVDVIRQMRHQGVSVVIASQDPPSLPNAIIELSSLVVLHRFNSPQWLKHIQRSITALSEITPTQMAALRPGEAYVWATKATERIFMQRAVKMNFRPRLTLHGGGTKTAV